MKETEGIKITAMCELSYIAQFSVKNDDEAAGVIKQYCDMHNLEVGDVHIMSIAVAEQEDDGDEEVIA